MNRALPEMLHCLNIPSNNGGGGTELSVLERQQARMKWQQEQLEVQEQSFFNGNELSMFSIPAAAQQFQELLGNDQSFVELMSRAVVKPDPGTENSAWPDFGKFGGNDQLGNYNGYGNVSGIRMNYAISRTASCPPVAAAAAVAEAVKGSALPVSQGNLNSSVGRESFTKRKADKTQNQKVVSEEEDTKEKRIKGCAEEGDSKITQQNSNKNNATNNDNNNSGETSEKSKISEVQKPDYIHVRARRGQATDSHSLAERVRREKISERMKYLQDLVPGCNKITGKAGMLDEIINYVQSLQRQVEFLSMKLAAVNPRLDFNIENFLTKEMFPASTTNFPTIGASTEMATPAYFQLDQLQQQVVSCCGLDMGINPPEMALRRTISAPLSIPDQAFIDSPCFNQIQPPSTWDPELQNLYGMEFQEARLTTFQSQQFTGSSEGGNLKMEM